jgi:hypothetical protein
MLSLCSPILTAPIQILVIRFKGTAHVRIDLNQEVLIVIYPRGVATVTVGARDCIALRRMLRTGSTQLILKTTVVVRIVQQSVPVITIN